MLARILIREILRYAGLRHRGSETGAERRDLLDQHRQQVRAHGGDQARLQVLDAKIAGSCAPETERDRP